MTNYEVEVFRDGKWWMADISELDVLTQARRLAQIEDAARDAIAVTLDIAPNSFDMTMSMRPIDGLDIDDITAEIQRVHGAAEELEKQATAKSTELTRNLAAAGVPLRDIGTIIGRSHQRAHQLLQ